MDGFQNKEICEVLELYKNFEKRHKGSSIKYVRNIFRKTNMSNPWYAHVRACIRGLEMLVFWKLLCKYLMDGP